MKSKVLLTIKRYLKHHEDIDMDWVMSIRMFQNLDAITNLPHKTMFTLNKVV